MNTSENLKEIVDLFGKLSFMLETHVKLEQTKDHEAVAIEALRAAEMDCHELAKMLTSYFNLINDRI